MNFKDLNKELRNNQFHALYIFTGNEEYLKDFYEKELVNRLTDEATRLLNLTVLEDGKFTPEQVEEIALSYPTFAEKKVLIIKNSGIFQKQNEKLNACLEALFADIPDYLCIILREAEIDKRKKLYKQAAKHGAVFELNMMDAPDLKGWIVKHLGKHGKTIRNDVCQYFIENCDSSMYAIMQEIEKLASYTGDAPEITKSHIDEIVTKSVENKIFEMVESITANNKQRAFLLLRDLKILKEPEVKIASIIATHITNMLYVKIYQQNGMANGAIAKKIGKMEFVVRKYAAQGAQLTVEQLEALLNQCRRMDMALKTSAYPDGYMPLELFIAGY